MLFLDRYEGQSVILTTQAGERIKVEVIGETESGAIRIGFDAPRSVDIRRMEKVDQMKKSLGKKREDEQPKDNAGSKFPSSGNHG